MEVDKSRFTLPNDTGICLLECRQAFEALSVQEKKYAHFIAQASWHGSLICLFQTSPESPGIFLLFQKIFREETATELKAVALSNGLTEEEFQAFLIYVAGFYGNMGNYKSFGDTKIIPNLEQDKFSKLVKASAIFKKDSSGMEKLLDQILGRIYNLEPKYQQLGLGHKGITTYFSGNCHHKDAKIAQEFMSSKDLSAYNTRLFKYEEDGRTTYEIRQASANTSGAGEGDSEILGCHKFTPEGHTEEVTFKVTRGDYAPMMQRLVDNLSSAKCFAANEHETLMLTEYARSFAEGSIPAHKDGSRHWIKNKGPIIETYIGFIESYRDPFGVRGEFEGFVAMVNKEMSAKFGELVARAEHFLPLLPWPSSYEKDTFLRPDFTSLDVLAFGSSGVPAGINIPNYDDIRQCEGFKNVSLGNVLSSAYKDSRVTFLTETDKDLYTQLKGAAFEVQVGIHELLGHGSGKLFYKDAKGEFNFDHENVKHTETNDKISSWYTARETWDSKFQTLSSSYEECRAECVGIYLCLSAEILQIFGHKHGDADNIIYINWLNMARAGLLALEFYTPETNTWGQAHMQARYVILRVLLEAGEDLVTIEKTIGEDGQPDLILHLDRSKINTVGKEAIGTFLTKLQVYKSTADYAAGKEMYNRYSAVTDNEAPHFLSLRTIVLKRKLPRKMFVQCNTTLTDDDVSLTEYEATAEGVIKSFVDRFPSHEVEDSLQQLWDKDSIHFQ